MSDDYWNAHNQGRHGNARPVGGGMQELGKDMIRARKKERVSNNLHHVVPLFQIPIIKPQQVHLVVMAPPQPHTMKPQ
jgi:hypothetical protein